MVENGKGRHEVCTIGTRVYKSDRYHQQRRAKKLKVSQQEYLRALYKVDREYPHLIEKYL